MRLRRCIKGKIMIQYCLIFGVQEFFYMQWFLAIYHFVKKMIMQILIILLKGFMRYQKKQMKI